ncbi:RNA polymerase sigma-70 factor [Roseivirga pacifica]|uniref:RNA polymerase sigma-70 factor n=1 Tax=Roseivirga pacifica TaxID=1267423 RepID=UPI003BAD7807
MERLIADIKSGNERALALFVSEYHTRIFNYCYTIIGSKQEAEELAQDVFLKIWSTRSRIDEAMSLEGLLFTIAKNLTLNKIRDNKKLQQLDSIEEQDCLVENTMEEVLFNNMQEEFKKLVRLMPERRRMIFELSRFEGLGNKEIALRMGISINTVEGQMRKALKFISENSEHIFFLAFCSSAVA